ncbi:MAG: hypothetical protein ABIB61_04015 [Candidatus Shapirobacteria bacterium]
MIKKIMFLFLCFLFLFNLRIKAQAAPPEIYFFWSKTCPHCHQEEEFLNKLDQEYPEIEIKDFEVSNPQNLKLQKELSQKLGVPEHLVGLVPFTVIGDKYLVGFRDENTTGEEIREMAGLPSRNLISFLGKKIDPKSVSLPILTIILGLLDGFNPCAMWTLLFLISLLLRVKEKKRRWILGLAFLFTSGLIYFLIMAAWFNLFLVLGFVFWVRILIGLVAIAAGLYSLNDWRKNKEGGCQTIEEEKRDRVFEKIKELVGKKQLFLALTGIILLAVAVNLVELVCSAGLPAIYTQVLSLNDLPSWRYYLYILIYILFFMIDDLFVFGAAMITLQMIGIESKYARISRLVGGILILFIGLLLLFRPQWLIFG